MSPCLLTSHDISRSKLPLNFDKQYVDRPAYTTYKWDNYDREIRNISFVK